MINLFALFAFFITLTAQQEKSIDSLWQYDQILGWKNAPDFSGKFPSFLGFPSFTIRINKNGFRDDVDWYDNIRHKKKVLILGDSVCFGFGLEFKDTVGEQLEKLLGDDFVSLNLSCVGYSTDQELILFEKEGIKYDPDFVVFCLWVNDIAGIMDSMPLENGRGKPVFKMQDGKLILLNVPVKDTSLFPERYNEMFSIIYGSYALEFYLGKKPSLIKRNLEYFLRRYITHRFFHLFHRKILSEYLQLLYLIMSRANEICRTKKCKIILVLIPDYYMTAGINKHVKKIYEMIAEKIKFVPVVYVDMDEKDFFKENLHPNSSGHKKIAEKIFSVISRFR